MTILGKKGFGNSVTSGVMGDFGADEWARFGSDEWARFGVENLNYEYFGGKVPQNYFGGELTIQHAADGSVVITHQPHGEFAGEVSPVPTQTLSDFKDRLKMGWAKLTGKPV